MNIKGIIFLFAILFIACGEEQRRGTPHQGSDPDAPQGQDIRPGIDGSEATGPTTRDTISTGDQGATSY